MSLSTQGLTSLFFSSVLLGGLSKPSAPPRAADRPCTCFGLEAGPGGLGVVGRQQGLPAGLAPSAGPRQDADDGCHGCSWYGSLCQGQGAWPRPGCTGHPWGQETHLHVAAGGASQPGWLCWRAHSRKQGHRAITPQWCLLQTPGWRGCSCVGLKCWTHQSCPGCISHKLPKNWVRPAPPALRTRLTSQQTRREMQGTE